MQESFPAQLLSASGTPPRYSWVEQGVEPFAGGLTTPQGPRTGADAREMNDRSVPCPAFVTMRVRGGAAGVDVYEFEGPPSPTLMVMTIPAAFPTGLPGEDGNFLSYGAHMATTYPDRLASISDEQDFWCAAAPHSFSVILINSNPYTSVGDPAQGGYRPPDVLSYRWYAAVPTGQSYGGVPIYQAASLMQALTVSNGPPYGSASITQYGIDYLAFGTGLTVAISDASGNEPKRLATITSTATGTVTGGSGGTTGLTLTGTTTLTLGGTLGTANGGTGLTATPGSGQILTGTGTGYALANVLSGGTW